MIVPSGPRGLVKLEVFWQSRVGRSMGRHIAVSSFSSRTRSDGRIFDCIALLLSCPRLFNEDIGT